MVNRKVNKELDTPEAFDKALREELSVSTEFDLPLCALALRVADGWDEETTRPALDALRVADLVCQPSPEEILVALPNTGAEDARLVEERLRQAAPQATVGISTRARGDTVETLLGRARGATDNP